MTTGEKVHQYLKRIGFNDINTSRRFETLQKLQRLHLQSVPYENLDIIRDKPISLEPDDLFDKVVNRRRGGYCFELNGLFAWLLRAMGFTVTEYLARFLRDEETGGIPMRRHRVLRVTADGADYLCDVGVGGAAPRKPLPLISGASAEYGRERYKLEKEPFWGYVLYEWRNDAWKKLYAFTEEEQLSIDFIMPSFYCEKHPDSDFRKMDMVHLFTENGRRSVAGREIRLFSPSGLEVIHPINQFEYERLLLTYFGLKI